MWCGSPGRAGRASVGDYTCPIEPRVIRPEDRVWITRPHAPNEPRRHVAELSDPAGIASTRANIWRYEPGAVGRRHRHAFQEETFVVIAGTLSIYLGDPAERADVPTGGVVHVPPRTPLQSANHGTDELVVFAYGYPPEEEPAELLDPAVQDAARGPRPNPN